MPPPDDDESEWPLAPIIIAVACGGAVVWAFAIIGAITVFGGK